MRIPFLFVLFLPLISYSQIKLEEIPRLDTKTALKILVACHEESLGRSVDVAIVVLGIDGRILASSKSEKWIQDFTTLPNSKLKLPALKGLQQKNYLHGMEMIWRLWI